MNKMIDIDAIPGERWFPKETNFEEDMPLYWGEWGVASEVDTLRAVLMRRPGKEIEGITDPAAVAMNARWDVGKVREQHDALAEIYRSHGIDVYYIEDMDENLPNAIYATDLVYMTTERAIIATPPAGGRKEK